MARNFNGTSDHIIASASPVTNYPMTLAAWVRPTTVAAGVAIYLSIGSNSDTSRVILGRTSGSAYAATFNSAGNSRVYPSGTTDFTATTWAHVALVIASSTSVDVLVNGSSKVTSALTRGLTNIDRIIIGARTAAGTLGEYGNGDVAEVGIWNVALTAAEIASLAKGFRPDSIRPQSLAFYAPLVREIIDVRGGLTLTASGTSVATHPRVY